MGTSKRDIGYDTPIKTFRIDSLTYINFIVQEEELDIEIDDEYLASGLFSTVRNIIKRNGEYIVNRIKLKVRNLKRVNFFIPECMEHAAVAYGETMGLDLTKAFSGGWYFNLKDKRLSEVCRLGECIEEKIIFNREYREYNGVQFDFIDVQDVDELLKVIDANLANNLPTIIHMDTYYSYWGFLYQKVHSAHLAVAVAIDPNENKVWIVDPEFSEEAFSVDVKLLEEASRFYVDVKVENVNKYSNEELMEMVCSKKEDYKKQFDQMEQFAKNFKDYFVPSVEFGNEMDVDCVLDSELITRIRELIKGRNLFIVFLEQFQESNDIISQVIDYLYISIGKWNTVMNMMFKSARTRWRPGFNEKVYSILMSAAQIEREAYEVLQSYIKGSTNIKSKQLTESGKMKCIAVDIVSECNNKGFVYQKGEKNDCDLTGDGEYVLLNAPYKNIIYNGITFKTCFGSKNDNIVCRGQTIYVDTGIPVLSLDILLCAEWGGCEDSIKIIFENGYEEIRKIVANDISDCSTGDVIEVGCSKKITGEIVNSKVFVTYNRIAVKRGQERVKAVQLPVNPHLHVLAVSKIFK